MERLDAKDQEIVCKIFKQFEEHKGPRVGDFIIMKDGNIERFSHDWGDDIQTCFGGSFWIGNSGNVEFSGGLNSAVMKNELELVPDDIQLGEFWIFHHHRVEAHNGVYFNLPCRTYKFKGEIKCQTITIITTMIQTICVWMTLMMMHRTSGMT